MQCPGCLDEYGQAAKEYWRHDDEDCQGVLQLDEYANVICSRCGLHAHITEMQLYCNSGRHKWVTFGVDATAASLSCSAAFVNNMGLAWLQSVIKCLAE